MPLLPALLDAATLAAVGATAYTAVLAAVALTSVLSPAPEIRRDARATLTILLRRRRRG
ncbi:MULTISPECIES: hypothetical protein [Streptomyces]|uniref:hypothetical protein n=1 Tax=Streptomyces TaxID=1883 RepID=UPI000A44A99B|nr:hypothetical protein [Streptomyces griseolus]